MPRRENTVLELDRVQLAERKGSRRCPRARRSHDTHIIHRERLAPAQAHHVLQDSISFHTSSGPVVCGGRTAQPPKTGEEPEGPFGRKLGDRPSASQPSPPTRAHALRP